MTKTQSQSKNQTQSQDPIQKYHEEPYKKFFDNDGIPLRWYQTGAGITFIILLTLVILVIAYIIFKFSKKEGVQDSEIHETEVELEENEWLAYRDHWKFEEEDKLISKSSGTYLKKKQVDSSQLTDDLKIQILADTETEVKYLRQLNNNYYVVYYDV